MPENKHYSWGIDVGLATFTDPIVPIARFNFDYRISDQFQTGISFLAGPTQSYFEPHLIYKIRDVSATKVSIYPYISVPYHISYTNFGNLTIRQDLDFSVGISTYYQVNKVSNIFTTWSYNSRLNDINSPFTHPKIPIQVALGMDTTTDDYHYFGELIEVGNFDYFILNTGAQFQQ